MAETTGYMTSAYTQYEDSDDPEVIRAQIEQTRANMTRTVNSIQEKLAPQRLAQQAKDTIREATIGKVEEMAHTASRKANRWSSNLTETIKQNPVPAALIGIGLGWLLMKGSNGEEKRNEYHYYPDSEGNYRLYTSDEWNGPYYDERSRSRVGSAAHAVQERAGEMASSMAGTARNAANTVADTASSAASTVADTASNAASTVAGTARNAVSTVADTASNAASAVADTARSAASTVADTASSAAHTVADTARTVQHTTREQAHYLANQAKAQARYAKTEFEYLMDTNPLALGVVAVAAGAIIGLMLPRTQTEDRLMGETRDRLMDQAKSTAKETMSKVQNVAGEAYQAAKETALEEAENQDLPMAKQMAGGESGRRDLPVAE
jgi:hypothetical protein